MAGVADAVFDNFFVVLNFTLRTAASDRVNDPARLAGYAVQTVSANHAVGGAVHANRPSGALETL